MDSTIHLTPFEEQILQALAIPKSTFAANYSMPSADILLGGRSLFGDEWGGPTQLRNTMPAHHLSKVTCPQINLALGRLAKKGLVDRVQWKWIEACGYQAGQWFLTEEGKLLLGIE